MKPAVVILLFLVTACVAIAGCSSTSPPATATTTATPAASSTPGMVTATSISATPTAAITVPATTGDPSAADRKVTLTLVAEGFAFDKSTITVPAGATVVMTFDNKDSGVPHNFALYTDSTARQKVYGGGLTTGPETTTYRFNAPMIPKTYFFRCDVHPTTMTGSFVVT